MSDIRIIAANQGITLWRNNSGAWFDPKTGRWIRYGLGNHSAETNKHWKSSDWIGIGPGGRLVAWEEKPAGWIFRGTEHERAQKNFLDNVRALGGIADFIVR